MKLENADVIDREELAESLVPAGLHNGQLAGPKATTKIRLLVVDDDPLVRKAIVSCMAHCRNLNVVGELGDPRLVVSMAQDLRPDVIFMDIGMPQMSGVAATRLLKEELPGINVLILSIHQSTNHLRHAMAAGARGYALKGTSAGELARAVEVVQRGEIYLSPEMMQLTVDRFVKGDERGNGPRLTEREREVLMMIAEGRSNKETAAGLGVSVRTVETHRENLMRKLDIHSAAGLARFALTNGFI